MFTTGSRLYFGLAVVALAGLAVYAVATDWGALGTVGLISAALVLVFLGGLAMFTRDADVPVTDEAAHELTAAAAPAPGRSAWPLIGALGAGLLGVGLVTEQRVFVLGVVVLFAAIVEWMVQAWSERASADGTYNARVRSRILDPLEYPVLSVVVVGVIIYFISRIFLAIDKDAGAIFFIVLASLILLFGALFAFRRNVAPGVIAGIVVMGVAALAVGGAAAAINGERDGLTEAEAEDHFSKRECGPERSEYWDRKSMNHVSAKTGEAAILIYEDGVLRAEVPGLGPVNTLTLPRANQVYVIFQNEDSEDRRLVANRAEIVTGADGTTTQETTCTQLTGEGQAQWLPLKYEVPSDPADPYRLFIAGNEEASVEVRVP